MNILKMSKKDFLDVPKRESFDAKVELFNSLVVIPTRRKHDSGFMCMDFVAVNGKDEPICRLSGCSDVIHLDGIGGYGKYVAGVKSRPIEAWSIDCIPCGYLRIFCNGWIEAGSATSSFEIYWHDRSEKKIYE